MIISECFLFVFHYYLLVVISTIKTSYDKCVTVLIYIVINLRKNKETLFFIKMNRNYGRVALVSIIAMIINKSYWLGY